MQVNDIIKTQSGKLFVVKRTEVMGKNQREYLLLNDTSTGKFHIAYMETDSLKFVNDKNLIAKITKAFNAIN